MIKLGERKYLHHMDDDLKLQQKLELLSQEYAELERKIPLMLENELERRRLEHKRAALKKEIQFITNRLNPDIIA